MQDTDRLQSWIFQITRNAIFDYYRKASRQPQLVPEAALATLMMEDDSVVFNQQMADCLRPLLEYLPQHYREAVQLVELDGMPQGGDR